jgi:hypothetical protein
MPSGPLLAALAVRAIDEQEAARSRRPRPRRLTARLGQLAARRDLKAPVGAGEERLPPSPPPGTAPPRPRNLTPRSQ